MQSLAVKVLWSSSTVFAYEQQLPSKMAIPIFDELREILDAGLVGDLSYLVTDFGKPHTPNGFGNKFRIWVEELGLKGKSAHGLRKSAAKRLVLDSHSTYAIAAIGGGKHYRKLSVTRRVRIAMCWRNR